MKKKSISPKRWTDKEDDILEEIVIQNESHIVKGLQIAALQLNRSFTATRYRWYNVLTNPEHPKYRGNACFMVISKSKHLINRKIYKENYKVKPESHNNNTIFKRILNIFKKLKK